MTEISPFAHLHQAVTSEVRCLQELMLLEDHILHAADRCQQCMLKHALKADAYAREAIGLTGSTLRTHQLAHLTASVLTTVASANAALLPAIPSIVRQARVQLTT
jgi:hypothetical protein